VREGRHPQCRSFTSDTKVLQGTEMREALESQAKVGTVRDSEKSGKLKFRKLRPQVTRFECFLITSNCLCSLTPSDESFGGD
jgi:hypothetical protein